MENFLPFVSIDAWTLIFTWVNLLILFLLMKRFFFAPVAQVLKKRDDEIRDTIDRANAQSAQAEIYEKNYKKKLSEAEEASREIILSAREQALFEEERIIKNSNEKARNIIKSAQEATERVKKDAMDDIRHEISQVSVAIAEKLIERSISEKDHKKFIDSAIKDLGDFNE